MAPGEVRTSALTRRDWMAALAIGLVACGLRLVLLFHSLDRTWPHSTLFEGDAIVWANWASALGSGQEFEFDLPFRAPLVAFFLHVLGAHGAPFLAAKVVWCVVSASTASATYLVLARWFSRRAGWIAATWITLSFASLTLATSLNGEALYACAVPVFVGATLAWVERPTLARSLPLGAVHGLALLVRPEHALLLAISSAYGIASGRKKGCAWKPLAMHSATVLGVALALCVPWMLRSHAATQRFNTQAPAIPYATAGVAWTPDARAALERLPAFARAGNFAFLSQLARDQRAGSIDATTVEEFFQTQWGYVPEPLPEWTLVSFKGGFDFALANHPESHGGFSRAALADAFDAQPTFSFARPSHANLVAHGYAIGWRSIRADPARWWRAVGEKLARFRDGATLGLSSANWPYETGGVRHAVDLTTPQRSSGLWWKLLLLGSISAGLVVALRRPGGAVWTLLVLYKFLVTVLFYGYARQSASIEPALVALSALAIDALLSRLEALALVTHGALRKLGWTLGVVLILLAGKAALAPPALVARPAGPGMRISAVPLWGVDAFESVDDVVLSAKTD